MKLNLLIFLFLLSCNSGQLKENTELEISIKFDQSYEIDIAKGEYTINYFSRPPQTIKFGLTVDDRQTIKEKYFSLGLSDFSKNVTLEGNCNMVPISYTYIVVKAKSSDQKITISEDCKGFGFFNEKKAEKVKEFIQLIRSIIETKPEIKNAPKSDVHYI